MLMMIFTCLFFFFFCHNGMYTLISWPSHTLSLSHTHSLTGAIRGGGGGSSSSSRRRRYAGGSSSSGW